VGDPEGCARLLTGLDAEAVIDDGSPRGSLAFALLEPPLTGARGEAGVRLRRTATAHTAELLARLVRADVQTLAFIRSRRGAEAVALAARRSLAGDSGDGNGGAAAGGPGQSNAAAGGPGQSNAGAGGQSDRVAAYRSGYLAEDRRGLEAALGDG